MRLHVISLVLFSLFILSACDSTDAGEEDVYRAYLYTAQNADSSTDAARGHLDLRFDYTNGDGAAAQIEGKWSIDKLSDAGDIGPQTGEGELSGELRDDGSVRINLNPDIADQNVILTGNLPGGDPSHIKGQWNYQTLSGSTQGDFEALQVGPLE